MTSENDFLLELQKGFLDEAADLLAAAEESFIRLESNPKDDSSREKILRLFHNIKGSAAAVGFESLSKLCHRVENLLVLVADKRIELSGKNVDLLLRCNDTVVKFVAALLQDRNVAFDTGAIEQEVDQTIASGKSDDAPAPAPQAVIIDQGLLQDFVSDASDQLEVMDTNLLALERNASDLEALNALFRAFHTVKSASAIMQFTGLERLAHAVENVLDQLREAKSAFEGDVAAVCFDAVTAIRRMTDEVRQGKSPDTPEAAKQVDSLVARIQGQEQTGTVKAPSLTPEARPGAEYDQSQAVAAVVRDGIKVDAEKLDRLIDVIGEIVISETMVAQSAELKAISAGQLIFKHLDRLNKLTRTLQEIGMSLRMVPIRHTFRKMSRIVRDVSKKLDKKVELKLLGEDTELDKTVADKIGDPLVHMVRNAIDHGIEKTVEERLLAGKPEHGTVALRAFHKGGSICIEIEDDGRGIDRNKLLAKAVEKGIVSADAQLTDHEVQMLVFHPGLSTAEKVTDVSGRGVGMDVVKRNIEELHGQVDIQSTIGKGTLFSIRIPHTLAIIEGMVVAVGRERYVVPTYSIIRSVRASAAQLVTASGKRAEMLNLHGEILPLFRLGRFYSVPQAQDDPEKGIVMVVEEDNRRIGLLVDEILRQQQFVIKGLGGSMKNVPGISGGTIMPDGNVGLILDVGAVIKTLCA